MKKYITTIAFTFIGLLLFAQKPEEKSLLWEISGKDLKQPSYLYGTFHLICPEDLVITTAIEKAIGMFIGIIIGYNAGKTNDPEFAFLDIPGTETMAGLIGLIITLIIAYIAVYFLAIFVINLLYRKYLKSFKATLAQIEES